MDELTSEQLKRIMPRADANKWLKPLNDAMREWEIDTPQRMASFLAQIAHESGQLKRLQENLSYSAKRMCQVWPSRFPDEAFACAYERNPERLANRVYSGRMGNGNEASGDGWRYRGRGLIQLTGRSNYASCSKALEVDLVANPDALLESDVAARSAGWYWYSRGLNELADHEAGADDDEDFIEITRLITGGKIGLQERIKMWDEARDVLGI